MTPWDEKMFQNEHWLITLGFLSIGIFHISLKFIFNFPQTN